MVIHFEGRMCCILTARPKCCIITEILQIEGLYSVLVCHKNHATNPAKLKLTIFKLHKVLGHVSQTAVLNAMKKGLIEGVKLNSTSQPEFCDICMKAKSKHKPFPKETESRAERYGERIHTDLWGPSQTESLGGCKCYISFTDDCTCETKVHFLKAKSEALAAFKQYETHLSRHNKGIHILKLRSDRRGEYLSAEFDQYLHATGIERELTVHDSPEQNGVAECLNGTLVSLASTMLLGRSLPKFLWAEAVSCATWLKNHLPSHAIPGHTPYDLVHGSHPDISMAHEFGETCYVHLTDSRKLDTRAEEAVFVGINAESKAYRVYWPGRCKVSVERNVTFTPSTVTVADDVVAEGEPNVSSAQMTPATDAPTVLEPPPTPSTPPQAPRTLKTPLAPRPTHVTYPPGYYTALNNGSLAALSAAVEVVPEELLDEPNDERLTHLFAMAAAEPEPTL